VRARRFVAGVVVMLMLPVASRAGTDDPAAWVDPFIGTLVPGFVNPGPVLPHGMVALGPDTEGPLNYGGYYRHNSLITGFSHIHMSAGVPRGAQIPLMPVTGEVLGGDLSDIGWTQPVPAYSSAFDHATEVAEPGYYAVQLDRYAIGAELTATERAGMHRYRFPAGVASKIVVDVGRDLGGRHPASATLVDDRTLAGSITTSTGPNHTIHFVARFDRSVLAAHSLEGELLMPGSTLSADGAGVVLDFGSDGGVLVAKVGISYVDQAGAAGNLDAEIPRWDFDEVRSDAVAEWRRALSRVEVEGGTAAERISFTTALYHSQLFPNVASDVDGRYLGADGEIHSGNRPHYSHFSLWDSYRGQNQLLAEIDPVAYRDMIGSLLDFHRQSGSLPRWQLANRDQGSMSGDPVIPFVAEGWCRGLVPDDAKPELFEAMREMVERRPEYIEHGYQPVRPPESSWEVYEGGPGSTGTSLEYGVAEFSLALMADRLERETDRDTMVARAMNYRNLLDPQTGWIRPRFADGSWLEPFHPELGYGFQEGTSWQYSWLAMQDLRGLFDRMGGDSVVRDRLDTLLAFPATATVPVLPAKAQNQATVFGIAYYGNQYAPGNEHDLEAPFLYNYAGAPWKTQASARGVVSVFTPTPDGLPGNDDLGALSGWLVWAMLGIYPMTPGAPMYTVASPVFTSAVVHRPTGDLTISAPNASTTAKYVQSATLNGAPLDRAWFTESDLQDGATVTLAMDAIPNVAWGAAPQDAPPSASTHALDAFGCGG